MWIEILQSRKEGREAYVRGERRFVDEITGAYLVGLGNARQMLIDPGEVYDHDPFTARGPSEPVTLDIHSRRARVSDHMLEF